MRSTASESCYAACRLCLKPVIRSSDSTSGAKVVSTRNFDWHTVIYGLCNMFGAYFDWNASNMLQLLDSGFLVIQTQCVTYLGAERKCADVRSHPDSSRSVRTLI